MRNTSANLSRIMSEARENAKDRDRIPLDRACRSVRGRLCRVRPFEIPLPVNPPRERMFNVPGAVLALAVLLVGIHLVVEYLLNDRQADQLLTQFASHRRDISGRRHRGCRRGGDRNSGPSSPMLSSTPTSLMFFST